MTHMVSCHFKIALKNKKYIHMEIPKTVQYPVLHSGPRAASRPHGRRGHRGEAHRENHAAGVRLHHALPRHRCRECRCVNDNNIDSNDISMFMIIFCPVPCESGYMYDCNSGECQQCPHGSYQPQWGQTRSGQPYTRVQLYTCHVLLPLH